MRISSCNAYFFLLGFGVSLASGYVTHNVLVGIAVALLFSLVKIMTWDWPNADLGCKEIDLGDKLHEMAVVLAGSTAGAVVLYLVRS